MRVFRPKTKNLWDLPGAYRRVLVKPTDLTYRVGFYSDPDVDLPAGFESANPSDYGKNRSTGIAISFNLPTSTYATMAIRELLHCSTDPRQHAAATKRHRRGQ
jgi:tRNA pseudouridine13 synthase